jgi:oligopeptide transport system permease protein
MANLRARYHMDDPLWQQYLSYLWNLLQGDLGPSFKEKDFTVSELIALSLPVSLQNGFSAIVLALLIGIPAGIFAALRQNKAGDYAVSGLSMTGIVVPNFVMAQLAILIFGVWLRDSIFHLPAGGWNNGKFEHRILPVICLALPYVAYIARIMRGSMIETLRANFIRTAKAKGLPQRTIIMRHALKTALMPIVSFLGPSIAFILTGSMVIETIFQIPGIGRYFVQGALSRNYTLVMGVTIVSAALIILMNIAVDVAYRFLDPRVREERAS